MIRGLAYFPGLLSSKTHTAANQTHHVLCGVLNPADCSSAKGKIHPKKNVAIRNNTEACSLKERRAVVASSVSVALSPPATLKANEPLRMSREFSVSIPFFKATVPLEASPMYRRGQGPPSRVRLHPAGP